MKVLILSGVGGSTNWLPLVYPFIALIAVIFFVDLLVKYIKKRRALRGKEGITPLDGRFEDVNTPGK